MKYLININEFILEKLKEGAFADALRKDMIDEFLKEIKLDNEYNVDEPELDMLLDPEFGYPHQTYIQNISENKFIYYEGFSKYCWNAFKNQEQYKNKSKIDILDLFIKERATELASEFNYNLIKSDYSIYEVENMYDDIFKDYILKLTYLKN